MNKLNQLKEDHKAFREYIYSSDMTLNTNESINVPNSINICFDRIFKYPLLFERMIKNMDSSDQRFVPMITIHKKIQDCIL